jgi:hypothetical protein
MNWTYLKTHIGYLIVIALGLVFFRSWLQEHDARLAEHQVRVQVEAQMKADEQNVSDLKAQIATTNAQSQLEIAALQKLVQSVKTPAQAIAAIPDVSSLPLHSTPVSNDPTKVQVDAMALFTELESGKECRVQLDATTKNLTTETQIVAQREDQLKQQQVEITALRKKPAFWHRVGSTLKQVGIGIGIGVTIAKVGVL